MTNLAYAMEFQRSCTGCGAANHRTDHQARRTVTACALAVLSLALVGCRTPAPHNYFKMTVVDDQTHRGVPLVALRTTNEIRYYTDSNGVIAFLEPGLMDRDVFFTIKSHGYEFQADGFGTRGRALRTTPGRSATLGIKSNEIISKLMRQGVFATVNQVLDPAAAATIALDYGIELTVAKEETLEEQLQQEFESREASAEEMWSLWSAFFDRLRTVMFPAPVEAMAEAIPA